MSLNTENICVFGNSNDAVNILTNGQVKFVGKLIDLSR